MNSRARADVGYRTGIAHFRHPQVGDLYLRRNRLSVPHSGGQHLIVFHAEPGSPSATGLEKLRSLDAVQVSVMPRPCRAPRERDCHWPGFPFRCRCPRRHSSPSACEQHLHTTTRLDGRIKRVLYSGGGNRTSYQEVDHVRNLRAVAGVENGPGDRGSELELLMVDLGSNGGIRGPKLASTRSCGESAAAVRSSIAAIMRSCRRRRKATISSSLLGKGRWMRRSGSPATSLVQRRLELAHVRRLDAASVEDPPCCTPPLPHTKCRERSIELNSCPAEPDRATWVYRRTMGG